MNGRISTRNPPQQAAALALEHVYPAPGKHCLVTV